MTARPPAAAPTPPSATTSSRSTPTSPTWRGSSPANLTDSPRSGSRGSARSAWSAWPPPSPTRSSTPPAAASAPCRSPSTDSYDEGVVSSSPVRKSPGRRKDQQVGALARRRGGADQQRRRHSWRYPMRFKSLDRLPRRTRQRARREDRRDGRFAARYDKQHVDTAAQMVSQPDGLITTRCIYWLIDCAERPDLRLASLSLNELGARAERRILFGKLGAGRPQSATYTAGGSRPAVAPADAQRLISAPGTHATSPILHPSRHRLSTGLVISPRGLLWSSGWRCTVLPAFLAAARFRAAAGRGTPTIRRSAKPAPRRRQPMLRRPPTGRRLGAGAGSTRRMTRSGPRSRRSWRRP